MTAGKHKVNSLLRILNNPCLSLQCNPCITASQGEMDFGRYIGVVFAEGFN